MKIKKLSVQGFKSFMDRTEITFPFGISGVVGPNGCGKSNIIDAIRWCMGEQSPKSLRGRRMEDVIFNGAGQAKPLGMTEVSILFENGNGIRTSFAHDKELSVTRRLYRSGESEYLINNVPCRLKDIQEIFMDTGLGNRTYSIIGQGKIETIIEQRPEETRLMLEEAAGITKYRKKVEESQKRMELTETNLQRMEDIMGEVERQMRSLKRQVSKAKRYKAISEKINNMELMIYANRYHQLKEESGDKVKSAETLVQEEVTKSTELSKIHSHMDTIKLEFANKEADLARVKDEYARLKERIHKKEAFLESLTGEIRMQRGLADRLMGEQARIRKRMADFRQDRAMAVKKRDEVKERFDSACAAIGVIEKRVKAREEFLERVREEYEQARTKLSTAEKRELGLAHESAYINKMLGQISDSRSRLEKELSEVKVRIEKLSKALDKKNVAREGASERLRETRSSIEREKMDLEELEEARERLEAKLRVSETELNLCESRLSSLQTLAESFEGYKMGVRTIMKAKDLIPYQQGRILGLLADIINVDPKYELSVEVVLGDKLQYVITESHEDAKEAVAYLKNKGKGRSSFVALKEVGNREDCQPCQTKNTQFVLLADVVSVPEKYKALIKYMLGDIVLVETLDAAISAWKQGYGNKGFVTVDGDLVDQKGVVSGGRLAQSSRGLLSRKREIDELKKQVVSLSNKSDTVKDELKTVLDNLHEKKKRIEDLTEKKWDCQEEVNELDKNIFRLAQELDQQEKLSLKISEEMERKDRQKGRHEKELLAISDELRRRKSGRLKEEEYFKKKEIELKECENEFNECRNELTKLRTDRRVFEEEQHSLTREIERIDEYIDDSVKRLQKIENDILQSRKRCEECEVEKQSIKESLTDLYAKVGDAEEAVNHVEQERQEFQGKIREKEKKAEELRKEITMLKENINRARMEHSEIRFKMNGIEEIVKEKFNLDLLKVYSQYIDENFSHPQAKERLEDHKMQRQKLGEVNLTAIKEYEALKERHEFMKKQKEDLLKSIEDLRSAIKKINKTSVMKFRQTLQDVDQKLKEIFPVLFSGGTAGLRLTDESRPLESGVLVEVQPPGKKVSYMGLLSGGEKALTAMALLFAIYMIKPSPFCLLDEVDAPLDEANVDRFNSLLRKINKTSQIIMVTHNRKSMEITDRLYGVTMEKAGISKLVSVDIDGLKDRNPPRMAGLQN